MALNNGYFEPGLIHHYDSGVQYDSNELRGLLECHYIYCSMIAGETVGTTLCCRNFFPHLKVELIHGKTYNTRQEAKTAIFEYIEWFYNS